jgi:O-antigen ligase
VRGVSLRNAAIAAGAVVVCWIGLLLSYSQSSFGGLIAAVLIVAAVIWHRRAAMAIAVLAVVLLSASVASPHVRSALFKNSGNGLNESTSGRAGLVSNGIKIARQNPVFGVGVGGFKHAYADLTHLKGKEPKKAASHNTPVTVAAESGIPGLALLVWLVGAALVVTFRRLGRSFEHRAALFVGLATAAIFVHSLFYADFFEDPTTWGLLGLAALSAAALERRREERV